MRILSKQVSRAFFFSSYLWPVLLFPHLRSSSADEPGQECRHSSSRPLYSRRWPCRRPGSAGLRRRFGEPRSSCGPAGPPAAGCLLVCGSKHQEIDTFLILLNDPWPWNVSAPQINEDSVPCRNMLRHLPPALFVLPIRLKTSWELIKNSMTALMAVLWKKNYT